MLRVTGKRREGKRDKGEEKGVTGDWEEERRKERQGRGKEGVTSDWEEKKM